MICDFKQSVPARGRAGRRGFTLVEVAAALILLVGILSAVMVVMGRAVEGAIEMRSRRRAFEVARENLESLLTVTTVSDQADTGYSEQYPEIRWELRVEPFYEPISNKMWIRAVSVAGFSDDSGQEQTVELEHWLTGLTAQQIKQILDQQKLEEEILKELYGDQDDQLEEIIKLYLTQAGLDVSAYENLLKQQRREKLDYLIANGYGDGYEEMMTVLEEERSQLLDDLGVDFDALDKFIAYLYENPQLLPSTGGNMDPQTGLPTSPETTPDNPDDLDYPPDEDSDPETPNDEQIDCSQFDCSTIDPSLKPLICQLTGCCCN